MSTKTTIIQFWDSNTPEYIQELLDSTRLLNQQVGYRFFDDKSSRAYIGENYGSEMQAVFDACALPAMRADFFRYCFLYQEGGFYIDADFRNLKSLSPIIDRDDSGCLYQHNSGITNSMIFVRDAKTPLMEAVLNIAVENINNRKSNSVWGVTGPAIFRNLKAHDRNSHLFENFYIIEDAEFGTYFDAVPGLDYKAGDSHWTVARDKGISIFTG